jgi:hypothetical protein
LKGKKVYKGWIDANKTRHITVNRKPLRHVEYHSEEMSWGYVGSGPADTALSILANYFSERPRRTSKRLFNGDYKCWHYHQAFKRDFVAGWGTGDDDSWQISSDEIATWLETQPGLESLDQYGRTVISFQDLF